MGASRSILVLTPDFPPARGGIQVLAHRLVTHLPGPIRVLTVDQAGAEAVDAALVADVRRVHTFLPNRQATGIAALIAAAVVDARRFRPDVVLNLHVITAPAAVAIARMRGVPYVQYVHAEEVFDRPRLTRLALRRAAAVVAVSGFARTLAVEHGAPPERVHRIPNGVDLSSPAVGGRSSEPTIVTVSRLADRFKGHDVMLRALPLIVSRVPLARWVVIGEGPLRNEFERIAAETGLTDRALFLGSLDDAGRNEWLDRARVFVMPSRLSERGGGEGFGIAYLEAGAHGLPVVAGAVGGALDAVLHDVTGLLVDPTDPAAVADAVAGLLLDPARAEALGRAGRRRAEEMTWAATASALAGVLDSAVNAADGAGPPGPRRTLPSRRPPRAGR
jgi:phosphatidylinositol alpha-1,6-mannosyltransferase